MVIQRTLEKISRLYELVEEMRGIVGDLREVQVDVRIRPDSYATPQDPLNSFAALTITLRPGCEASQA